MWGDTGNLRVLIGNNYKRVVPGLSKVHGLAARDASSVAQRPAKENLRAIHTPGIKRSQLNGYIWPIDDLQRARH